MSTEDGSTVLFRRAGRKFDRGSVRAFARRLQAEITEGRPFICLLTDDRELRRLNREFLGKDYATDVLAFPADNGAGNGAQDPLGEIALSVDRAADQAREFGHSIEEEIGILMLHGALHLMGMDHEGDRGAMNRAERRWRKSLGLPAGLIERADRR